MSKPKTRTLDVFLSELADQDLTIKEWASRNGFGANAVYMVVHGRSSGQRGQARKVIRAMGLALPPAPGVGRAGKRVGGAE